MDERHEPRRIGFYMDSDAWPGGAELWLTLLMTGLADAGWWVSLALTDKRVTDGWAEFLADRGIEVTRVRATHEVDPGGAREAEEALRGFPVVHVNKAHPRACLPAVGAARRAGARAVVVSEHVVNPPRSRYPFGAAAVRRLVRASNEQADVITAPSDASRQAYIEAYRPDPAKVATVRGAVDLSRFEGPFDTESVRRSLGIDAGARVAAVVGRLHAGKGLDTALLAVPLILEQEPEARLVIVGGGELASELDAERARLGIAESVIMAGTRDDVPAVLAASDVLVVPSESETAGLTALEAGAARLAVVATRVGGLPEAVDDGVTGLLVPPRDERALARAVLDVLSDPARASAMGDAGRERVEREFSSERLVADMTSIYERFLGARPCDTGDREGAAS